LALGKTLYELEHSISQSELYEWMEYLNLYPLHEDRSEFQLSVLTSSVLAPHMKDKVNYKDFMVTLHEKDEVEELEGQDLEDYIINTIGQ